MKKIFLFILALILSFITFLNLFAMHESSKVMTDSSPVSVDSRSPMPSEPSSIATGTTSSVDVKDDMSVTVTPDASLSKDVENGVTPGIATEKPMVPSRCGVNNQDVDCAQLE